MTMKPLKTSLKILFASSLLLLTAADCNGPVPPEEEELWKKIAVPEGMGYFALDFLSSTNGWCAGVNSIGHWDGNSWKEVKSFNDPDRNYYLWDIFAVSSNDIWTSGRIEEGVAGYEHTGIILHFDGNEWDIETFEEMDTVGNVWMFDDGTGWGGGAVGLYYYDGNNWSRFNDFRVKEFFFFAPNDGWLVTYSDIYRWNGTEWTFVFGADGVSFYDIYFTGPNDGWAVSHPSLYGVAAHYRWDGTEWSKLQGTPFDEKSLDAVHFLNSEWGWVIGSGRTYFYDGEHLVWKEYKYAEDSSSYHVDDIYCLSENDVWISAYPNFLHFTGFIE